MIANAVLAALALYGAAGLVFGIAFVTVGVQRIDHTAVRSPWSFRLLILPGAAALWPLLLRRWIAASRGAP